jgi:hypothetical protein
MNNTGLEYRRIRMTHVFEKKVHVISEQVV